MAKESRAQAAASLRALTYRVSSTPAKQLPQIAPQVAASLWNCRSVLSAPGEAVKANSETTQAVNRFRSTIAQLLQARSVEERWAGVVLAKATIEAGGREILSKATGWTKSLIAILKKNDPSTAKVLAVITLTRTFMLTWEDANLVREITTPALPGFVQACLASVEKSTAPGNVLQTILEAFAALLPRHSTIFRTFESQMRTVLLRILSTTASAGVVDKYYTADHQESARRLLALLHHCAPKQGGAEKWNETVASTVTAAHTTCDRVFRSVHEGWKSTAGVVKSKGVSNDELRMDGVDALGLSPWQGLFAGVERVIALVQILEAHMDCTTANAISVRLGVIMDLLDRLLSIDASIRDNSSAYNAEISKDERDALLSCLPAIHVASLDFLRKLLERFGLSAVSVMPHMVEMLSALFAAEMNDVDLRTKTYQILSSTLDLVGPTLTKDNIADLSPVIKTCCEDLLPTGKNLVPSSADKQNEITHQQPTMNGTSGVETTSLASRRPTMFTGLESAAAALLPLCLTKLDQSLVHSNLRVKLEQTAVLTQSKDALVACVLNPPKRSRGSGLRPSLLPLLARQFPDCAEVEAILRPRMPVVGAEASGRAALNGHSEDVDMDEGASASESESDEEGDEEEHDGTEEVAVTAQNGSQEAGEEEFFSTAPEQPSALFGSSQTNKRPAESHEETSAKRLRASPVASALDPSSSTAAPGMADVPVTAVVQGKKETRAATQPAAGTGSKADGADDDDSDFEIPPLTMESDSEVDE